MVKQRMDLLELLRKRGMDGDVDLLREALRVLVDGIMDAEVSAQIGAQHGERSPDVYLQGQSRWTTANLASPMTLSIFQFAGLKSLYNNKMTPAVRTCSCLSSHAGGRVLPSTIVGQPGG